MKMHLNSFVIATSALLSALALAGCGGGSSNNPSDSSPSALTTDVSGTDSTSTSASADTNAETMDEALAVRRWRVRSGGLTASTAATTVATSPTSTAPTTTPTPTTSTPTTAVSTPSTAVSTTTVPATTTPAIATPSAIKLSWASPAANTRVSGMQTVALSGQAFKNVEIFSGGIKIATATVSSDLTTATATIDTTKLANGTGSLTAHAWDSAAGTAFTSEADAGTLSLVVSNAAATTAAATTPPATTTTPTTPTSAASTGTLMGVNIHTGGGNTTNNQKIADVMNSRQLKTARMDFNLNVDLTAWRDQVTRLKAYGIKVETDLQTSYQWDHSCSQNLTAVEQDAYTQTVTMVQRISDIVQDFELLNEVPIRPDTSAQIAPFNFTPASSYPGKSCFVTMAAVLRGMSRAIVDQRNASGAPLKIILGTVGNDYGFLTYMQQQGVTFDIVGYHVYPSLGSPTIATDPWYGAGGPLAQLAQFKKPVRINEFNCGEIYTDSYNNVAGSSATNACLAGIQKHLQSLLTQKLVTLESVHAYELTDGGQAGAEGRFGLMYDVNTPKALLAAYALFAGGTVSATEKAQLTAAGVSGK